MKTFIVISGNIAAGKSTFLSNLKKELKDAVFVREPIEEWENFKMDNGKSLFNNYCIDQYKYGFLFQLSALTTRWGLIDRAIKENPDASIFILERSPEDDRYVFAQMLYDEGKISRENLNLLDVFRSTFENIFDTCKWKNVYLKTPSDVCLERLKRRNRLGEENLSKEYLEKLEEYTEKWMIEKLDNKIVFDGSLDCFSDEYKISLYNLVSKIYLFQ